MDMWFRRGLLACVSGLLLASASSGHHPWQPLQDAAAQQIAVIPFQTLDDSPASVGTEIAEEISNSLNRLDTLAVLPQDVLRQAKGQTNVSKSLPDALALAKRLRVSTLVVGSYKKAGGNLQIDCWVVDVKSGAKEDDKKITEADEYPKNYVGLLYKVPEQVSRLLRPAAASTSHPKPIIPKEMSASPAAHLLYSEGLDKADRNSEEGLTNAKAAFQAALKKDADYAQAYVAKSDTETQLARMKEKAGKNALQDRQDAVSDAFEGVKRAPYYGGAHWQLSRALTLIGNYEGAAVAARVAAQLWPANAEVAVDLNRALSKGKIVDGPDLQRALKMTPALSLVIDELPKVTVVNDEKVDQEYQFVQESGAIAASVEVPASESRVVGLASGRYTVTTTRSGSVQAVSRNFSSEKTYDLNGQTLSVSAIDTEDGGKPVDKHLPATLKISSEIGGAKVSVGGSELGEAPQDYKYDSSVSPTGTVTIQVTKDGYEPFSLEIHAAPGVTLPIVARLKPGRNETPTGPAAAGKVRHNRRPGADDVFVPGGDVTLGDDDQPTNPVHKAHITSFWISKTLVTYKEFLAFAQTIQNRGNQRVDWFDVQQHRPAWGWIPDHPVVNVSWEQAQAYAKYVGGRLPTEAEWEYAARGPDRLKYPWGNNWDPTKLQWSPGSVGSGLRTTPVTAHATGASPFGCLDMAGNVWEWCFDAYSRGLIHGLRGGSWRNHNPDLFRPSLRRTQLDVRDTIGFRVVFPVND